MKSFKGTLILAVIVAGIGGFAFFEYKKANQEKEAERTARHLIKNLQVTDVAEVRHVSEAINFTVKAEAGKWMMELPQEDVADTESVESLIRGIAVSDVEEVGSESPDWAKYGLDKPVNEIFFKYKNGKEDKIAVGRIRSFDQGFYLRLNDGKNFLVAPRSFDSFVAKSAKDLRSRKFQMPDAAWGKIQLISKKKDRLANFGFELVGGKWQSTRLKSMRLNEDAIMNFRRAIEDVKGDDIVTVDNTDAKRKDLGLGRPELTIDIEAIAAPDSKTANKVQLLISSEKDGNVHFTSNLNRAIYKTAVRNVEALFKIEDDFRDRKFPFEFEPAKVTKVKLVDAKGQSKGSFRKDGISWVSDVAPEAGKVIKQAALEEFVKAIASLDIRDFSNKSPGSDLKSEISLLDAADQPVIKLNFGRPYKVKDDEFYVVKASTSADTFGVRRGTFDELLNREFFEAAPAAVAPSESPPPEQKK